MNAKDLKRLATLLAKSNRSEAEEAELTALREKAAKAEDVSIEAIAEVINEAVKSATTNALTADQVKSVVAEALKTVKVEGVNKDEITSLVTEAVKKNVPAAGASLEDVKKLLEESLKNVRQGSKMEHSETEIIMPVSHRSGNLSVGQKQLLNVLTKGESHINEGIRESDLQDAEKRSFVAEQKLINQIKTKAMTNSGAGTGLELMNSTISSQIIQRLYLASLLAQRMVASEIVMPSDPYKFPLITTRPVFRSGIAQNTTHTGSDVGSGGLTLTSQKLIGSVDYSYEADEDSLIPLLPMITEQLGDAAAEALEDALINGDTAGSQDTGTDANAALKIFDGLRKLSLAQADLKVSFASTGLTAAAIGSLRKAMGKYGMNPRDLIILAGAKGYNDIVQLPETLTAEKAGDRANARIFTGMAPNLFGMDIIPSAKVREDLNASGVFDNTTTTKGSIHVVHVPSFVLGVRRGLLLETEVDKKAQTKSVIASFRRAFKPKEALTIAKAVATGYNYTA
ncbi:MAG: phage major capsid protein [Opitutaceae bacterium]|nr:phage major capsid protein [Opitutaceae bacterium]